MKDYQLNGENAATSSASDPNANMNLKNVANMESEVYKFENRKTQRTMLYDEIEKLYGKELAEQYLVDLTSHIIYSHDEASSPVIKNYCEAVTLFPLLEGTGSLDGTSTKAPKHLDSFCGQLVNTTFLLASQCKGAVAFGEFFNFFDHFAVMDYGEEYDLKRDVYVDNPLIFEHPDTIEDKIKQQFQHVVFN
jgi:ribonucleoside-triphosphate reductase